jgi:hypothetical protein
MAERTVPGMRVREGLVIALTVSRCVVKMCVCEAGLAVVLAWLCAGSTGRVASGAVGRVGVWVVPHVTVAGTRCSVDGCSSLTRHTLVDRAAGASSTGAVA